MRPKLLDRRRGLRGDSIATWNAENIKRSVPERARRCYCTKEHRLFRRRRLGMCSSFDPNLATRFTSRIFAHSQCLKTDPPFNESPSHQNSRRRVGPEKELKHSPSLPLPRLLCIGRPPHEELALISIHCPRRTSRCAATDRRWRARPHPTGVGCLSEFRERWRSDVIRGKASHRSDAALPPSRMPRPSPRRASECSASHHN